ncbi:MAG: thiamine-phosphate pyrophosphorylase [Paracoccaceae bacterium]|jgi:thiamine-phosphate pyrophosphorylase
MADNEQPQIYLISPPQIELSSFSDQLAQILDARAIACFRLGLASSDEDDIARTADHLREICHARDVAIVIEQHYRLVDRLGLDGCHLSDGAKNLKDVRKELGADAIIGAHCGISKHMGMTAAEAGADYVCFGPVAPSALGTDEVAEIDVFTWWSEMIETPVVAEGGLTPQNVEILAGATDFFGIGAEIWGADVPLKQLNDILKNQG